MEKWVKSSLKKDYGIVTAVGTGGNISKIFELAQVKQGKTMSLAKIKQIKQMIERKRGVVKVSCDLSFCGL